MVERMSPCARVRAARRWRPGGNAAQRGGGWEHHYVGEREAGEVRVDKLEELGGEGDEGEVGLEQRTHPGFLHLREREEDAPNDGGQKICRKTTRTPGMEQSAGEDRESSI
jgi:hypothetical protein